jgi:hypothetical protein
VGKSCLLLRFADDTYTESYISTIGVDFVSTICMHVRILWHDACTLWLRPTLLSPQNSVRKSLADDLYRDHYKSLDRVCMLRLILVVCVIFIFT